jgi:hypothetical protein
LKTQIQLSGMADPATAAAVGRAETAAMEPDVAGSSTVPEPVDFPPPAAAKTIPANATADTVAKAANLRILNELPVP